MYKLFIGLTIATCMANACTKSETTKTSTPVEVIKPVKIEKVPSETEQTAIEIQKAIEQDAVDEFFKNRQKSWDEIEPVAKEYNKLMVDLKSKRSFHSYSNFTKVTPNIQNEYDSMRKRAMNLRAILIASELTVGNDAPEIPKLTKSGN